MPFFERENFEDARQFRVVGQKPFGNRKNFGEKRERDELKTDDDGHARDDQRADVQNDRRRS